tara:strand:- start:1698 stop:2174 length:477 start_codon:yes stop_codon:yes gene_type:complete
MKIEKILGLLRIGLGWIFLWAFIDKLFGLGFATEAENAWLAGGSPTTGFLSFAVKGPFSSVFNVMAGSAFVDWLFMFGLLLIGVALILGIGVKIAGYSGALMMLLMWLAVLPPEHNPVLDDHIIYLVLLVGLANTKSAYSYSKKWKKTKLVRKYPILA